MRGIPKLSKTTSLPSLSHAFLARFALLASFFYVASVALTFGTPFTAQAQSRLNEVKITEKSQSTSASSSSHLHQNAVSKDKHPIVALVLGGGGPRGAAHLGVLRVLEREHIPVDMIVGTSMGAIFGGLYCAGLSPDKIEEISDKHMAKAYYTVPIPLRVALIPVLYLPHLFGYHPYDGLYRGNKFAKWLDHSVPEAHSDISQFHPKFAAVAANLLDGKAVTITEGDLGRALQASSAIPFLRRPVLLQNKLLVDGGILANLPVKQARELGADLIIAVDVDETFNPPADPDAFRKIGSVPPRVVSMILAKVDQEQVTEADVHFQPDVNGISLLSKKSADAHKAMAAGEAAAMTALPEIRRKIAEKISMMQSTNEALKESNKKP